MKILMRTNMWPEGIFAPEKIIAYDRIGSNIGNMLFPYSVGRWIYGAGDIQIDPIRDSEVPQAKDINEKYDMLLMPFANAFRKDFIPFINDWTKLIKKLTIPCIVLGIGAQTDVDAEEMDFDFDKDIKAFCDAVLEKSQSIGVRGYITKKYLEKIGVEPDRVRVVGCPSMFINGTDYIPVTKKPYEEVSNISLNSSKAIKGLSVVCQWMEEYDKAKFIAQENWELILLYAGYQTQKVNTQYFVTADNPYYKEGRIHSFTDTISWLSYLKNNVDVSAGTRIHGNVAALVAGVPALVIASDSRVKEICEFFSIPYRKVDDVISQPSFKDWYEMADFQQMNDRYFSALKEYEEFWKENEIPYAIPAERIDFKNNNEIYEISSFYTLSDDEKMKRIDNYFKLFNQRWDEKFTRRGKQIQYFRRRLVENNDIVKECQAKTAELEQKYEQAQKEVNEYKKLKDKLDEISLLDFIRLKMKKKN